MNLKILKSINLFKTLYYNFKFLPFSEALKLPIAVGYNTTICNMHNVKLLGIKGKFAFSFGLPINSFIGKQAYTVIDFRGETTIYGRCVFGSGSKVIVDKDGELEIGAGFVCTGGCNIECHKKITFGKNCILSWNITILDTDFHPIYDVEGKILNPNKPITIGDEVWLGFRSTVLKGVTIADNVVVASNSTISKNIMKPNSVVCNDSSEIKYIKENIKWGSTYI
jgi:acetyltransferase-like isoleucine patch superfamily enzyme